MNYFLILAFCLVAVNAGPGDPNRIVGGSVTNIQTYPFSAVVLYSWGGSSFSHYCGSTILTTRSVLSAAHCFERNPINRYRVRVGSTFSNSGGQVHNGLRFINHPSYNTRTYDCDIAVLHVSSSFTYSNSVRAGRIAGTNYNLPDNSVVWAIGWGRTSNGGQSSPQLRHVQIWTVNQEICRQRYGRARITDNMLCSGWLDVGGRDQCQGDSGSPLLHNNVAVGVCSFGQQCALPYYPGVNARVSRFTNWISNNA